MPDTLHSTLDRSRLDILVLTYQNWNVEHAAGGGMRGTTP
jgi:hypothetical protein